MKTPVAPFILMGTLLLAGCTGIGSVVPKQSTMVEVRARAGSPTDIWIDRNGDEIWEYATGPSGYETHAVRFGADGQVKERVQLLTEERLQSVVPGEMTKADVRRILGRPSDQSFPRTGTVWSWRARIAGVQLGYFAVSFNPNGTVRDRMTLRDPSGDSQSSGRDQ